MKVLSKENIHGFVLAVLAGVVAIALVSRLPAKIRGYISGS